MRRISVFAFVLGSASTAMASEPYPGIEYTAFDGVWNGTDQRYHVIEVDLTHPGITLRMSNEHLETERWTSIIGADEGAVVAVNGNYSDGTYLRGYAMSDGVEYTSMYQGYNAYAIGWSGNDFELFNSTYDSDIPEGLEHAVSGCGWVVREGVKCDGTSTCPLPGCTNSGHMLPNPRTLIGVDQERTKAFLVAVDGRRDGADGMSLQQCATFMDDLGAYDAVNLDGGGSTTMWIASQGVVNQPAEQQPERGVPNAVLVHVDPEYLPEEGESSGSDDGTDPSVTAGDDPTAGAAGSRGDTESGCACRAQPGSGSLAWLLLVILPVWRRSSAPAAS